MITDLDSQKVSKNTQFVFVGYMKGGVRKYRHSDLDVDYESLWHVAQAYERDELDHFLIGRDKPRRSSSFTFIWTFCVGLGVIAACYLGIALLAAALYKFFGD
jgi:hypothetical protein